MQIIQLPYIVSLICNMKDILRLAALLFVSFLSTDAFGQSPEQRLEALGLKLPATSVPVANYVKWVRTGNLVYTSGHGSTAKGRLGETLTIDQGYDAAKETGLQLLATLKSAVGDLSKVKRVVKVLGMVNSASTFTDQPKVMNGFSDLMVAVFGEAGKHARSAVGMNTLPNGIALEIEMIVEVED